MRREDANSGVASKIWLKKITATLTIGPPVIFVLVDQLRLLFVEFA